MTRADSLDWCCTGREYTRPGCVKAGNIINAVELLLEIPDISRNDELQKYLEAMKGNGALLKHDEGTSLVTTVDQCHYRGGLMGADRSFIHNSIRYTGLQDTELSAEVKSVIGSWKRNNIAYSDEAIQGEVLQVYFPQEINHYAWMVSSAKKELPYVEIMENTIKRQAID